MTGSLQGKTILILSPQSWGNMFLSKHHYAIQLAKRGSRVYFLNPPDQKKEPRANSIEIKKSTDFDLFVVEHKLFFPYTLKFKLMPVFHWLMKFHIKNLLKKLPNKIDIVWSFDLGDLYPLSFFGDKVYKVFHPVDEPLNKAAINSALGANIIFSVTHEILDKYRSLSMPRYFVNHGVTESFVSSEVSVGTNDPIRIGFSGNLLRNDIDRATLLQVVKENSGCIFEFWGSHTISEANVGGNDDALTRQFVKELSNCKNVVLHGAVNSEALATAIKKVDVLLICYDVLLDQSKGTNYHKVMEYLATGKVIVSNNITTYSNRPDLIQMVKSRTDNEEFATLLKKVLVDIEEYNSIENQKRRIEFARENTYEKQILKIERMIYSNTNETGAN